MMKSSVLMVLLLLVVMCSVWTGHGRSFEVKVVEVDDVEQEDVEAFVEVGKLPGLCWACKWSLNKVKKVIGPNVTAEKIKSALSRVCNEIGLLKSLCRKFVSGHLSELIEELTTTDDVRTICVNLNACKSKDITDWLLLQSEDEVMSRDEHRPINID